MRSIKEPFVTAIPESVFYSIVAARNGVGNNSCHSIQWNIIDTESPDKIKHVNNMFLVRFGSQQSLG